MSKRITRQPSFFPKASPRTFSKKFLTKKQAKLVLLDKTMFLKLSYDELEFLSCLIKKSVDSTWKSASPISEVAIESFPFSQVKTKTILSTLVKKKFISIDLKLQNFYRICLSGLYKKLLPLLPQEYIDMEEFL